jgi:carbamoyltransferase
LKILGLNRTQDASLCVLQDGHPWSLQKERITRHKHHWGSLGDLALYAGAFGPLLRGADLIVECYSSDAQIQHLEQYRRELREWVGPCEVAQVSHHLAHVYSAFFPSGFDDAAVMVIDCQGSPVRDFTEAWRGAGRFPGDWMEVASFYACRGSEVTCIGKQVWDGDGRLPVGLGLFYLLLTAAIFPGEGQEGKVMGLAPFGDPDALGLPPLEVRRGRVDIPLEWLRVLSDRESFLFREGDAARFARSASLAAAGQRAFEAALLRLAAWVRQRTGLSRLCFAGGTALNCVANGRLLREGSFAEIFIPPAPHDGGTALGCALYGAVRLRGEAVPFRWRDDFLGPQPPECDPELAARHPELAVERPADLADRAAGLLESGRVLCTFQGRSESGPRALGHRSILADPRTASMYRWINAAVKGREPFRPLAPVVPVERAAEYFEIDRPLPFMQFAATVRPEARAAIPAATHVDGTARVQTVSRADDGLLHAILEAFGRRSGVPVLINTSFNGPGEPLVETWEQALELFLRTPLHALVAPPLLVRKRDEPELPS